jgi:hypothetical protein
VKQVAKIVRVKGRKFTLEGSKREDVKKSREKVRENVGKMA